ncbi:MAG: hypothetical protein N2035_01695 [Chthoniobacterales bacterium]|nr:hypothetical protein [Chthoniobacterales bacterium]MCX7712371.1 hypothetical protein [Chthoniobacterales bacterium]
MPIYEFYSPDTNKIYSFLARRFYDPLPTPRCPDGEQYRMQRLVSQFSFTGRAKEPEENKSKGGGDDSLDPRQEAALEQMAREFENIGDSEPDPKTVGRMMRRMLEISGQKAPAEMEEMLRRLEKGEDPEKLEEEFSDLLDSMDDSLPEEEGEESSSTREAISAAKAVLRRNRPFRDPQLYEFSEFI